MWIYSSGFPKGQDMGKLIEKREGKRKTYGGYTITPGSEDRGTAVCRKCGKGTPDLKTWKGCYTKEEDCPLEESLRPSDNEWSGWKTGLKPAHEPIVMARKPFKGSTVDNVLKHGTGAINIDDTRIEPNEGDPYNDLVDHYVEGKTFAIMNENGLTRPKRIVKSDIGRYPSNVIMSEEDKEYSKYFYCPKVSRKERNIGDTGNNHPTVKPVALMKYLVTLVTPKGGKVLDPFNGSGSTGMAVKEFGGEYTGIDLNPDYIEISQKRIDAW